MRSPLVMSSGTRALLIFGHPGNAKLEPLPYLAQFSSQAEDGEVGDIDIGIVPLKSSKLGPFVQCRFLENVDTEGQC